MFCKPDIYFSVNNYLLCCAGDIINGDHKFFHRLTVIAVAKTPKENSVSASWNKPYYVPYAPSHAYDLLS